MGMHSIFGSREILLVESEVGAYSATALDKNSSDSEHLLNKEVIEFLLFQQKLM